MQRKLDPNIYNSIHDYMDVLFYGRNPSKEEIILAKTNYWKSYNSALIRKRRELKSEFTIALTKQELKVVIVRMTKEKSITEYIRKVITAHLISDDSYLPVDTSVIEQQLFMMVEHLEDLLEIEDVCEEAVAQIELQIKHLESLIAIKFDNQE